MKKLCSLLLAVMMFLSLMSISASAAGSDIVLPKSPSEPGLTVTLTGVISTKDVKVLSSHYENGELVPKEKVITVYQLPLTGAELKFTGKFNDDLFPGGFGGYSLIDGKYQSAETGSEGQMFYISPLDTPCTEPLNKSEYWNAADIFHLYITDGIGFYFTFADLSAHAVKSENPFTDVSQSDYYYDAVIWALKNNVTKGITDTTFGPASTCTRGQVVTFLWRAQGCPEPETTVNPFTDVSETSAFYKAILWAYENGITTGNTSTTFNPGGKCTSGHVVTFLWRAQGEPAATGFSELSDLHPGRYYTDAIGWADTAGLLTDIDYQPSVNSPRSEIVLYLYRNAQ